MYPLKFELISMEKIWGGQNIARLLGRDIPSNKLIGETWEVSCLDEAKSIISNGRLKGMPLDELMKKYGKEIMREDLEKFPLLIKFIDANDKLSVQVHPNDTYAVQNGEDMGKTEMWYVVDAKPGAKLIYGLKKEITQDEFIQAVKDNTIEETLNEVEVKKGDVFFIPSGTVHAIGEGIVIAEIQQSSNTTYRLFDWNRLESNGNPRELHVEKALETIDFKDISSRHGNDGAIVTTEEYTKKICVSCQYFTTEIIDINSRFNKEEHIRSFEIYIAVEGNFEIEYEENGQHKKEGLSLGETTLIPVDCKWDSIVGTGRLIRAHIADPATIVEYLEEKGVNASQIASIPGLEGLGIA